MCRSRIFFFAFSILLFAVVGLGAQEVTVYMLNGDTLPCTLEMDFINLVSNYGEIQFPIEVLSTIQFPEPGKGLTLVQTVYGETMRGFVTNEIFTAKVYSTKISIRKAKISKIVFNNDRIQATEQTAVLTVRNGDSFYVKMLDAAVKIQASYGVVELSIEDIKIIECEGFGRVVSKATMMDGGSLQGFINHEYLSFQLLYESELSIVPDLIQAIETGLQARIRATFESFSASAAVAQLTQLKAAFTPPNMVLVKGGEFTMGSAASSSDKAEKPVHRVQLSYNFWMGIYEVTFDEYEEFCKDTKRAVPFDNSFGRGKRPVININWKEAIDYCNWLSIRESIKPAYDGEGSLLNANAKKTVDITAVVGYRLPTEAEWEFAARGGQLSKKITNYAGSSSLDEVGWYSNNSGMSTQPVGMKRANELGLYDMSGNVWEWCHDWEGSYTSDYQTNPIGPYSGFNRIARGGGFSLTEPFCTVTYRRPSNPGKGAAFYGFRIVRTVVD